MVLRRVERLLNMVVANRKNCSYKSIAALREAVGFVARPGKGSHVVFKRGEETIVIARRSPLKEVYVESVLSILRGEK